MKRFFKVFSFGLLALCLCLGTLFGAVSFSQASANSETIDIVFVSGDETDSKILHPDENGHILEFPEAPQNSPNTNASFAGWFFDLNGANAATEETVFVSNTSLYAKWIYEFEIAGSGDSLSISFNGNNQTSTTTSLLHDIDALIESNLTDADTVETILPITIKFAENLTFDSELTLNFNDNELQFFNQFKVFEISGDLNINASDYAISISAIDETIFNVYDFTLSSNADKLINLSSGSFITNICSSEFDGENYAIYLNSGDTTLNFQDNIITTCKYFANYAGKALNLVGDQINLQNADIVLNISVPYTVNGDTIVTNAYYDSTSPVGICLVPENDYYYINFYNTTNPRSIVASSANIKVQFESGEDAYFDDTEISVLSSIEYLTESEQNFIAQTPTKEFYTFIGWIGKIKIDTQTYYFDSALLQEFILNNFDVSYLSTNLDELVLKLSESDCFTYYSFSASETDLNFACINIFLKYDQMPTFVATYSETLYKLDFVTYVDSEIVENEIESAYLKFGDSIEEFLKSYFESKVLEKTGYTLDGWYTSADFSEISKVDSSLLMQREDLTLYARWTLKTYTVTYILYENEQRQEQVKTGEILTLISSDELISRLGYGFEGWYTDINFNSEFLQNTMPDIGKDLTLYAKWTANTYIFNFNFGEASRESFKITVIFGSNIAVPDEKYTKITGFTFEGWFPNDDYITHNKLNFFGTEMKSEFEEFGIIWSRDEYQNNTYITTIYGLFKREKYTITFVTNVNGVTINDEIEFDRPITIPNDLTLKNHKLVGWYRDADFTMPFNVFQMPAESITIYAKWQQKEIITINETAQTFTLSNFGGFLISSTLLGFKTYYLVDGDWTTSIPIAPGIYDVKVVRDEDENYAEFETIISGGFVLTNDEINLTWLIALFFLLFFIEIVACVIIKFMINAKKNMVLTSLIPFFSFMISSEQFVLLIISAVLVVFGLAFVIYELVKLHNTIPEFDSSKVDVKTINTNQNAHSIEFEDESENNEHKYSADDIQKMLDDDTYGKSHGSKSKEYKDYDKRKYESTLSKVNKYRQKVANEQNVEVSPKTSNNIKLAETKSQKLKTKNDINFSDTEELYDSQNEQTIKVKPDIDD